MPKTQFHGYLPINQGLNQYLSISNNDNTQQQIQKCTSRYAEDTFM